tara:strand:- start:452 stop:1945 length:1494 start_codon:yes stop_codon:yes gene_type:complete
MRPIYFFLTIFPFLIYSQDVTDAVNWSIENESGNARYSAMGGAFGALGGNLSAISSNPASGAVFELSRFGGSLVSNTNQTKSNFKSNINNVNSQNANYQIGLVYVFKNYGSGDLNKFSIGLNFQSQNNYNQDIKISGRNNTSLDNFFLNNAQGISLNDISVGSNESVGGVYRWLGNNIGYYAQQAFLGYQSYLLSYDSDTNSYYSLAKYNNGLDQDNSTIIEGYNNIASLNLSWQFKDNLYMGINLNFHDILYEKENRHIETNFDDDSAITSIDFRNYLSTVGNGISIQGGIIYKVGSLRFGISYKSPTFYSFEDNLDQYLETSSIDVDGISYTDIVDPRVTNIYEYNFKSPPKLTFSLGAVISNMILLNLDIISKNYSKSSFKHQFDGVYSDLNNAITRNLTNVLDYNIGTEIKINNFSLRGGYKIINSPYEKINENYFDASSFGLGYNFISSTVDIALVNSKLNYNYQLFDTGLTDSASINNQKVNIILSYNIIF